MKSVLLSYFTTLKSLNHPSKFCKKSKDSLNFTQANCFDIGPSSSNVKANKSINQASIINSELSYKVSVPRKTAVSLLDDCQSLLDGYSKGQFNLTREECFSLKDTEEMLKESLAKGKSIREKVLLQSSFRNLNKSLQDNRSCEVSKYILEKAYPVLKEYKQKIEESRNIE